MTYFDIIYAACVVYELRAIIITIGQRIWTKYTSQGQIFHGGQCNVTSTSWEHCSQLQQSCCHAVVEDWMIPFAGYTAAETRNVFQWVGRPPKLAIPVGSPSPSNRRFPGTTRVSPTQDISITSSVFTQLTCVPNRQTDTQTKLCATSITIGRIYAMWPNTSWTELLKLSSKELLTDGPAISKKYNENYNKNTSSLSRTTRKKTFCH